MEVEAAWGRGLSGGRAARPHERGERSMSGSSSLGRLLPHILAEQELINLRAVHRGTQARLQGPLRPGRRGVSWRRWNLPAGHLGAQPSLLGASGNLSRRTRWVWESGHSRALEAETNSEVSRCVSLKPTRWGFPGGSAAKEAACNQETCVQSLGWETPLEEMAAHSSTVAWRIPRTGEPGGL